MIQGALRKQRQFQGRHWFLQGVKMGMLSSGMLLQGQWWVIGLRSMSGTLFSKWILEAWAPSFRHIYWTSLLIFWNSSLHAPFNSSIFVHVLGGSVYVHLLLGWILMDPLNPSAHWVMLFKRKGDITHFCIMHLHVEQPIYPLFMPLCLLPHSWGESTG